MSHSDRATSAETILRRLIENHTANRRWLIALGAFVIALVLRHALDDVLPPGYPFLTFFPAVILTAFLSGLGPGIAVAAASAFASWYFFIPPFESFSIGGATALALGFFIFISGVDLAVIHYMFKWMRALDGERERNRQLAASRDLMFKEMQHRISNNLSVVSALLRMQRNTVRDEAAIRALDEAAGRLALVGKIHRQLHDPDGQQLPFGIFIKDLCHHILEASGTDGRIVCLVQADELHLSAERAVPVGLIVTELVSNALEHAFVDRERGTISIALTRQEGEEVRIVVADDGVGLPPAFDLAHATSLGLVVARRFAEQIGAAFTMDTSEGASAELRFSND